MRAQAKRAVSPLTTRELTVRQNAAFDLAAGYPMITNPQWLCALMNGIETEAIYAGGPQSTTAAIAAEQRLVAAVLHRLDLPTFPHNRVFATISGSVALERAITAFVDTRPHFGVTPEIDIIAELTREVKGSLARQITIGDNGFDQRAIDAMKRERGKVLTLSSPNNPTGFHLTARQFHDLAEVARGSGGGLIFDQCFALLGSDSGQPALAAAHLDNELDWAMIWDTGKTFGLAQEKLAFILTSGTAASRVRDSLSVIQYDLPTRAKLIFSEILAHKNCGQYLCDLRALAARNHRRACEDLHSVCAIKQRPAGPFAILRSLHHSEPVERIGDAGIGVVAMDHFTNIRAKSKQSFRIALLRDADYFDAALKKMREVLA